MPAEGLLNRLVHHPHAAQADLAEDAEVADLIRVSRPDRCDMVANRFVFRRLELLQIDQGREQVANLVSPVRQPVGVLGEGRPFAGPVAGDELFGHAVQRVAVVGRVDHDRSFAEERTRLSVYLRVSSGCPPRISENGRPSGRLVTCS